MASASPTVKVLRKATVSQTASESQRVKASQLATVLLSALVSPSAWA